MNFVYKTLVINSTDIVNSNVNLDDKLNTYGEKGWELVTASSIPCFGSSKYSMIGITQKIIFTFKKNLDTNECISQSIEVLQ